MGRRTLHTHVLDRVEPRAFSVRDPVLHTNTGETVVEDVRIGVCGYEVRSSWARTRDFDSNLNNITCPDCNKKLAKRAIQARESLESLEIKADKQARGGFRFQGGYQVLLAGETIGYVGYEDHAWRIYPLTLEHYDERARAEGPYALNDQRPLNQDGSTAARGLYKYLAQSVLSFKSKEAAALGCEDAFRQGLLKTGPALLAEHARYRRDAAREAQARAARRAEGEAAKTETLAGLEEILARESLSNFQRQALMNAIDVVRKQPANDGEVLGIFDAER